MIYKHGSESVVYRALHKTFAYFNKTLGEKQNINKNTYKKKNKKKKKQQKNTHW